jgi:hypothetical protein
MQALVKATPCFGVDKPLGQFSSEMEITDDLNPDIIGECVTQAVRNVWKSRSNFDPVASPFLVIVTFS